MPSFVENAKELAAKARPAAELLLLAGALVLCFGYFLGYNYRWLIGVPEEQNWLYFLVFAAVTVTLLADLLNAAGITKRILKKMK